MPATMPIAGCIPPFIPWFPALSHNVRNGEQTHMMNINGHFQPKPEHKFTFGLWTVGNRGRDPFGDALRPVLCPAQLVAMLAEVNAWGVNLHDDDLVPV